MNPKFPGLSVLKVAALVTAGIASFAAMALLRPADGDREIVLPTERVPLPQVREARPTAPSTVIAEEARLQPRVTRDPFGALEPEDEKAAVASVGAPKPHLQLPRKVIKVEVSAPLQPPAPTAPPLPFEAMGSISGKSVGDGRPMAFLKQRDAVLIVRVGDELEKTYRVEAIGADSIDLTYLPLNQRQSLPLRPN